MQNFEKMFSFSIHFLFMNFKQIYFTVVQDSNRRDNCEKSDADIYGDPD